MDAVILAGGFGKRIQPLTNYIPKPMLPIANVPALDYLVSQASAAGADKIIFTLAYMPEHIMAYARGYIGINVSFAVEKKPLGTAGGVKNAKPKGDFAVLSGDGISDIDLRAMMQLHKATGALVTVAVTEVGDLTGYGRIMTGGGSRVTGIKEKDAEDAGKSGLANTGVYIVSPKALRHIKGVCDFARDLFPRLLSKNLPISAYEHKGYWKDIGNCRSYLEANLDMIGRRFFRRVPHVSCDGGEVCGSRMIGRHAIVTGRAEDSVIGESCVICSDADIKRSVILPGAIVSGRHEDEIIASSFSFKASNPA